METLKPVLGNNRVQNHAGTPEQHSPQQSHIPCNQGYRIRNPSTGKTGAGCTFASYEKLSHRI